MSNVCVNCGHLKIEHHKGNVYHVVPNAGVRISKCKKFVGIQRWECVYCGLEHNHSIRPTRCSCRNGYVKHFKKVVLQDGGENGD